MWDELDLEKLRHNKNFRTDALFATPWCPLIASNRHFLKLNRTKSP